MISIIVYCYNNKHIQNTIDGILNTVPASMLSEILICNDGAGEIALPDYNQIVNDKRTGRAKSWNTAVDEVKPSSDILVFVNQCSKFSDNWIFDITKELNNNPDSIISPSKFGINSQLWSSSGNKTKSYKINWGLFPLESIEHNNGKTAVANPTCFAIKKDRLLKLEKFDNDMKHGAGVVVDISIKNILLGGDIRILESCSVSSEDIPYDRSHENTIFNNARIAETWLDRYTCRFYDFVNADKNVVDSGNIANRLNIKQQQKHDIKWFISEYAPELGKIYDLQNTIDKKPVAIICDGPSIDLIDKNVIFRNHTVIGIDHMGLHYDCDYVITLAASAVNDLRAKYSDDQIIVPHIMYSSNGVCLTSDINKNLVQFSMSEDGLLPDEIRPPFINFKSPVHCAVHIAAFMGASDIILYGFDNKIIGSRSHTTKIEFYNDGHYWPDDENTSQTFTFYEQGLDSLGKLLMKNNINLLRMSYV